MQTPDAAKQIPTLDYPQAGTGFADWGAGLRPLPPLALAVAAGLVTFFLLAIFWWFEVRPFYSPWGDEFSLIVNSTAPFHPSARSWFLDGFSHYFEPYPEWYSGGFDFIRPVANLTYYLNSLLFGKLWANYLLANYAFHAVVVGTTVYIGRSCLKLRMPAVLGVATLTLISPAFDIQSLLLPSFGFDTLAAAIVLAAIGFLVSGRLTAAWALFLVGSFTKEVTWFAPCVAAIVILLSHPAASLKCRALASAYFPFALLPAWVLRKIAFHGHMSAYTLAKLDSPMAIARSVGKGLLKWPAMPLSRPEVGFGTAWRPELSAHWYSYAMLATGSALSLAFWALLILGLWYLAQKPRERLLYGSSELAQFASLIFLCGSLVLPVLGCLHVRLGAVSYPLLFLCLIRLLDANTEHFGLTISVTLILSFIGVSSLIQKYEMLGEQHDHYRYLWAMSKSYIDLLHKSTFPVIITIDDVTGVGSSPESLQKFTGYSGRLVRGSDIDVAPFCHPPVLHLRTDSSDLSCIVSAQIPSECGEFELRNTDWRRVSSDGSLTRSFQGFQFNYSFGPLREGAIATQQITMKLKGKPSSYVFLTPGAGPFYVLLSKSTTR